MGTRELPKEYFNREGISVTVIGDTEKARELFPEAKKLMFQLNLENTARLPQYWKMKELDTGGYVQVNSIHGVQSAYIFVPHKVEKKKKKRTQKLLYSRYVPAYHIVDINNVWQGIALCMAGKWQPEPVFKKCAEDKIYPFEYGLWNTALGATRPEDYEERLVLTERLRYAGKEVTVKYTEIPAAHEYCIGSSFYSTYPEWRPPTWTGESFPVIQCCDDSLDSAYFEAYAIFEGKIVEDVHYVIFVAYDWQAIENAEEHEGEAQPQLLSNTKVVTEHWPEVWQTIGTEVWWNFVPSSCYVLLNGAPPTINNYLESYAYMLELFLLDQAAKTNEWEYKVYTSSISGQYNHGGPLWGSFTGTILDTGVFFYAVSYPGYSYYSTYSALESNCADPVIINEEQTADDGTSRDSIYVFGVEYQLRRFDTDEYDDLTIGPLASDSTVRQYQLSENYSIVLALGRRAAENSLETFEYLMFKVKGNEHLFAQYNDSDVLFNEISSSGSKHTLTNLDDMYANGDFSLIRIDYWEEEEEIEVDG